MTYDVTLCLADLTNCKTTGELASRMIATHSLSKWIDEWLEEQADKGSKFYLTCKQEQPGQDPFTQRRDITVHFEDKRVAVMFKMSLPDTAFQWRVDTLN